MDARRLFSGTSCQCCRMSEANNKLEMIVEVNVQELGFTSLISTISPVLMSGTGLSFSEASIALLFRICQLKTHRNTPINELLAKAEQPFDRSRKEEENKRGEKDWNFTPIISPSLIIGLLGGFSSASASESSEFSSAVSFPGASSSSGPASRSNTAPSSSELALGTAAQDSLHRRIVAEPNASGGALEMEANGRNEEDRQTRGLGMRGEGVGRESRGWRSAAVPMVELAERSNWWHRGRGMKPYQENVIRELARWDEVTKASRVAYWAYFEQNGPSYRAYLSRQRCVRIVRVPNTPKFTWWGLLPILRHYWLWFLWLRNMISNIQSLKEGSDGENNMWSPYYV